MCSIPEDGEHCPECFHFPDGKGGEAICPYAPEQRTIIEAVLAGQYEKIPSGALYMQGRQEYKVTIEEK
jgi:hypothetical protein